MKHLKVFESFDKQDQFDIENVMLYMVNILDDYKVNFFDVDNKMVNSNDKNINKFQLSKDYHSIKRSRFMIEVMGHSNSQLDYHDVAEIGIEMSTTIKHLEKKDWILTDYHLNQSKQHGTGEIVFYYIHYTFSREDYEIEPNQSLESSIPFDRLKEILYPFDIDIEHKYTSYLDNSIEIVNWDSQSLDYRGVEDALDKITNIIGASEWQWKQARNIIVFFF